MDLEAMPPEPDPATPADELTPAAGKPASRRRPMLLAGAGAAVALAVGSFAVGTALANEGSATVKLSNAAANTGSGTTGTNGTGMPHRFGNFRGMGTAGKVTSLGATSLVVGGRRGPVTVQTNGSTTYSMETTGQVSDAKVGSHVLVHGTSGANNTLAAQQIVLLPAGVPTGPGVSDGPVKPGSTTPPAGFPHSGILDKIPGLAAGTVAANDGGTLTITTASSTKVTVTTTAKTVVVEQVTASFDKIRVGDVVVAAAAPSETAPGAAPNPSTPPTNITATHVEIVPAALAALGGNLGGPLGMFGGGRGHARTPGTAPALGDKDGGTAPSAPSGAPAPLTTNSM